MQQDFRPITINPLGAYAQGVQFRQQRQQADRANALADYTRQNAGNLMAGDQSALTGYVEAGGDIGNALAIRKATQPAPVDPAKQLERMKAVGEALMQVRTPEDYQAAEDFLVRGGIITREEAAGYTFADLPRLQALAQEVLSPSERYQTVGGRLVDLAAEGGPAVAIDAAPPKPPAPDEYEKYKSETLANGEIPLSRLDFLKEKKGKGDTFNIGAGETSYAKERGKTYATMAGELQAAGRSAYTMMGRLGDLERALSDVQTGAGGDALQQLRRVGAALGWATEGVEDGELAQSVANQMALQLRSPEGGAGMPGALSDKDREFLVSMVPGLTKTPGGNKMIIEAFRRLAQRQIDIAELATAYEQENGRLDAGFDALVAEVGAAMPLFDDLKAPEEAAAVPQVAVTPDGRRMRYSGKGDPADPANWIEIR